MMTTTRKMTKMDKGTEFGVWGPVASNSAGWIVDSSGKIEQFSDESSARARADEYMTINSLMGTPGTFQVQELRQVTSAPKTTVYVLHIVDHRHGDHYWVFSSKELAKDRLARWAREEWEGEGWSGDVYDISDAEVIHEYFKRVGDHESWALDSAKIDGDL